MSYSLRNKFYDINRKNKENKENLQTKFHLSNLIYWAT